MPCKQSCECCSKKHYLRAAGGSCCDAPRNPCRHPVRRSSLGCQCQKREYLDADRCYKALREPGREKSAGSWRQTTRPSTAERAHQRCRKIQQSCAGGNHLRGCSRSARYVLQIENPPARNQPAPGRTQRRNVASCAVRALPLPLIGSLV